MDVHFKSIMDSTKVVERKNLRQVVLGQVLLENFPYEQEFRYGEVRKTLPFEDQLMTIRVKKEVVFDEEIFIVDILFTGMKREHSEMRPETSEKRRRHN